jgi:myo-inositol-1(or 4)-monophosphatase
MPDFLAVCQQAARAGGAALLDWTERFTVREKGPSDLVTDADLASQEAVRRIVLGTFPDHDFLSEEEPPAAATAGSEPRYRWIVDPLDGTTNYVHHIPEYAVSLALERAGEVVAATVFNPVHDECYSAEKGGGAYLNGRRLHVSGVAELGRAVVAASFPPKVRADSPILSDFARIIVAAHSVRRADSTPIGLEKH